MAGKIYLMNLVKGETTYKEINMPYLKQLIISSRLNAKAGVRIDHYCGTDMYCFIEKKRK